MEDKYKAMHRALGWVTRCIISVKNEEQFTSSVSLFENFKRQFPDAKSAHQLLEGIVKVKSSILSQQI